MGSGSQSVSYKMPSVEEMNRRQKAIEDLWREFLEFEGEPNLQYHIHKRNMFEVIKRQDQRMYYLNIFHDLDYPCEYKYLAVECFWLNTLKPFMVIDEKSSLYDCPNEKFSLYLIFSMIRAIFTIYHKDEEFKYPSSERIRDILYDFKYCSISREAMIAFVETFADNYGVGIEFILTEGKQITTMLKKNRVLAMFGIK